MSPGAVAPEAPSLLAGRRLCWAPAWPCSDAQVLFDAASGDYWLLSPLASRIVRALQDGERPTAHGDDEEDWSATLQRLVQVGLIEANRATVQP
ncbi:MAG: hypothetical protein ACK4F7_04515 [Inhella sp.]